MLGFNLQLIIYVKNLVILLAILYHCWGRSAPWAKRAPGNGGDRAPTLNLTQIDNLLRSCVHEIFVIVAIL